MIVVIEPIDRTGPRGDRDPNRHPYQDYRIHLLKGANDPPSDETVVHEVNGFDSMWTTIRPEAGVKQEAVDYAAKLAKRTDATVYWADKLPKSTSQKFKTIRAVVECRVPEHITEKSLVLTLARILEHPIQLGFKGNRDTLVKPQFKSYSRVRASERRMEGDENDRDPEGQEQDGSAGS